MLVEQFIDPEVALQFQMGPVKHRIAQRVRNRARKGHELRIVVRIARAVFLFDAIGAHEPPFVMVAFQPQLSKIFKSPITRNISGREVAVVIVDRLVGCEAVIEMAGGFVREQKIVVDKTHG